MSNKSGRLADGAMDCRQESCEAEGCGWEAGNRDAQSSATPTVWVTRYHMWLQHTTVRNTCLNPFLPPYILPNLPTRPRPTARQPATCGQLTTFSNTLLLFSRCLDPNEASTRSRLGHTTFSVLPFQRPRGSTWMQATINNKTHCLDPDT